MADQPVADPAQHMLSTFRHGFDEHDQATRRVVTFGDQVSEYHERLAAEVNDPGAKPAEVSRAQTLVAASMLREFAARLRYGMSTGTVGPDGEALAALAEKVSRDLRHAAGFAE